jgi:hypothetical protein
VTERAPGPVVSSNGPSFHTNDSSSSPVVTTRAFRFRALLTDGYTQSIEVVRIYRIEKRNGKNTFRTACRNGTSEGWQPVLLYPTMALGLESRAAIAEQESQKLLYSANQRLMNLGLVTAQFGSPRCSASRCRLWRGCTVSMR